MIPITKRISYVGQRHLNEKGTFELAKMKWSSEKIVSELKRLDALNSDLSSSNANKEFKNLYQAGKRFFGSWYKALESAGINTDNHVKTFRWTKDLLIKELQKIYKEHGDLSGTFLQSNGMSSIPVMSKKLFGSYNNALIEAGFNPDEVHRKKHMWTEHDVEKKIREVYEEYDDLSKEFFKKEYSGLVGYCDKAYGGWYHTLKHFGYPTDGICVHWKDDAQIIDELKRKKINGESLAHSDVENNLALIAARRFGSWEEALKTAGIDPEEHRKYNRWTKEKMLEKIKEYYADGYNMCNKSIFQVDSALASSYKMYFDSWDEFLIEAGIFGYDFSNNLGKAVIGYRFQALVKQIFKVLNIKVTSQVSHNNLRPDFTLNESTWIDAKLSSWTALSDGTLEKYCPAIDFLLIVYLRGNPIESSPKVNFIPIDDFFPALVEKGRQDLIEQLFDLRKAADLADKAS